MDQKKKKKFRFETFTFEIYGNSFDKKRGGVTIFPFKIPSQKNIRYKTRIIYSTHITRIQYHFYFPSLSQFYQ